MKLSKQDLDFIIAWGKSAKSAGFGDNSFNRDDANRKLLNRLINHRRKINE